MASILKVDTLQKPDGSTPTAADLGIDVSGSVVQVVNVSSTAVKSTTSTSFTSLDLQAFVTPKFPTSKLLITFTARAHHPSANSEIAYGLYVNDVQLQQWYTGWNTAGAWADSSYMEYFMDASDISQKKIEMWFRGSNTNVAYSNPNLGRTSLTIYEIAQ